MPDQRLVRVHGSGDEEEGTDEEEEAETTATEESLEDLEKTILGLCSGIEQRARGLGAVDKTVTKTTLTETTLTETVQQTTDCQEKPDLLVTLSPIKWPQQEVAVVTPLNHKWLCQAQSTPNAAASQCPTLSRKGLLYPSGPDLEVHMQEEDNFPAVADVYDDDMTYEELLAEVSRISAASYPGEKSKTHISQIHLKDIVSGPDNFKVSIQTSALSAAEDVRDEKYFSSHGTFEVSTGRFTGVQKSRHVFDESSVALEPVPSADILGLEKFVCSDLDLDDNEDGDSDDSSGRFDKTARTRSKFGQASLQNAILSFNSSFDICGVEPEKIRNNMSLDPSHKNDLTSFHSIDKLQSSKEPGEISSTATEGESDVQSSPVTRVKHVKTRKRKLSKLRASEKEEGECSTTDDNETGEHDMEESESGEELEVTLVEKTLVKDQSLRKDKTASFASNQSLTVLISKISNTDNATDKSSVYIQQDTNILSQRALKTHHTLRFSPKKIQGEDTPVLSSRASVPDASSQSESDKLCRESSSRTSADETGRNAAVDVCTDRTAAPGLNSSRSTVSGVATDGHLNSSHKQFRAALIAASAKVSYRIQQDTDFVLSLSDDEDKVNKVLSGSDEKASAKTTPKPGHESLQDSIISDACQDMSADTSSAFAESYIVIDSLGKDNEDRFEIIDDPVKINHSVCVLEKDVPVQQQNKTIQINVCQTKPKLDNKNDHKQSTLREMGTSEQTTDIQVVKPFSPISAPKSGMVASVEKSAVQLIRTPVNRKDLERSNFKVISPISAPKTDKSPQNLTTEKKTLDIRQETRQMKSVREKWGSKGIPRPDDNLTWCSWARKKNKESKVAAKLEGSERTPPLFRDNVSSNKDSKLHDDMSPQQKKRRTTPCQGTSNSVIDDLCNQLSRIEAEKSNMTRMMSIQHEARIAALKKQHNHNFQALRTQQNIERRQYCQTFQGYIPQAFLEHRLMMLKQEHTQQVHKLQTMISMEMKQLLHITKQEKDVQERRFNLVIDPKRQMIKTFTQQSRASIAQLDTAPPHATVELWKGPCKSNRRTRTLVEVCLPTDIASFMIREDEIYDAFYIY